MTTGSQTTTYFTICAKNFTAFAKTLHASLARNYESPVFIMALADGANHPDYALDELPFPVVRLNELGIVGLEEMASRYNITEFNTAIKPFVFRYLFKQGHNRVVYIDPDVYMMSPMEELERLFDRDANCVLTPHVCHPGAKGEERPLLQFGVYNLGFLGLANTPPVRQMIDWWCKTLFHDCRIDLPNGLFVDQKWADLFPAFLSDTAILRHPGYNVAYWNLSQRTVSCQDGEWLVNGEPLRFVHFSGFRVDDKWMFSRHSQDFNRENIGDLVNVMDKYRDEVCDNGHREYLKLPYDFGWDGESGANLHTPAPASVGNGTRSRSGGGSLFQRVAGGARTVLYAKRSLGGWLPLVKRSASVLMDEGAHGLYARFRVIAGPHILLQSRSTTSSSAPKALPKLLVYDWSTPDPTKDAGGVVMFHFLKILVEMGYDVTFLPADMIHRGVLTDNLKAFGIEVITKADASSARRYLARRGMCFSAFILFRAPVAASVINPIRKYAPDSKIVLATCDLHYLRQLREAQQSGDDVRMHEAESAKVRELDVIRACDVSLVVSPVEQEILGREAPDADVRLLPLLFAKEERSRAPWARRKDIVFLGGFRHLPNEDAVLYFCEEVWPLVRARLPGVTFKIVGSYPSTKVQALENHPGVEVLGFVEDLGPVFEEAMVSVCPLRYGAGIKGKVATSMAHGVPVVGTTMAFEGMPLEPGEDVLVANDPAEYTQCFVDIFENEARWQDMRERGLDKVQQEYSEIAIRRRTEELLDSLELKSSDFCFHRFSRKEEYDAHRSRMAREYEHRRKEEKELIQDADPFILQGYCAVCNAPSSFSVSMLYSLIDEKEGKMLPNWREHLNCVKCGFISRIRFVLHILQTAHCPHPNADMYITEQVTPLYRYLKRKYWKLVGSEYLGDAVKRGAKRQGVLNEDLMRLSFDSDRFDYMLSLDVLEHVPDADAAFAECYRVLRPGGTLLFTVPISLQDARNRTMARQHPDGTIEHFVDPPEYHGNPVDLEGGSLCFRYFGWEVLSQLTRAGFKEAEVLTSWSKDLMYLGGELVLIAARK